MKASSTGAGVGGEGTRSWPADGDRVAAFQSEKYCSFGDEHNPFWSNFMCEVRSYLQVDENVFLDAQFSKKKKSTNEMNRIR